MDDALQAEHDAAAEAVAVFEAKQAEIDAQLKEERRAVNDRYRAAAAALEAQRVAAADPNRPAPTAIAIGQQE